MGSDSSAHLSLNQLVFNLFNCLCFFQLTCSCAQLCYKQQSSALLDFKQSFLENPYLVSWNDFSNCCSWYGVECENRTGEVIGLYLGSFELQGTIYPNSTLFRYFPHLQVLDFSYNGYLILEEPAFESLVQNFTRLTYLNLNRINMSSVVPESILNLTGLTQLSLSNTGVYGKFPTGVFQLPHLQMLELEYNFALTGSFPTFLNSSSPLQYLLLDHTNFSGELPDSIGNLKSLIKLSLSGCQFYGSIPPSLGNLTAITTLDLSPNNFSGMLPSLSNLKNLEILALSQLNLTGTISDILPSANNLYLLFLDSNQFSGPFPSLAGNFTELETIDLQYNLLTGTLPSNNFTSLGELFITGNSISGTIPSWVFSLPGIYILSLSYNLFSGQVNEFQSSSSLILLDLSHNNLHGTIPNSTFGQAALRSLRLSSNKFSGSVPLEILCNANSIEVLDIGNNNFSGSIPQCLVSSSNLAVLDLQKNNFSGIIPDTFRTGGQSLQTINLNGNTFEGPVPKSLAVCEKLEVLDLGSNYLSDKFPLWLEDLPNLSVLILHSNNFHGHMPISTAQFPFPNLRVLDISQNYFTGPLPKQLLGNFKAMINANNSELQYLQQQLYGYYTYYDSFTVVIKGSTEFVVKVITTFIDVDFSENQFEGEIPGIIGRLNSIRGLNLSHNSLTGLIPTSLGNLTELECLDLSFNKLTGDIPQQLEILTSLEVLNLSDNQLVGPIPQGNQFSTFSNDSYIGNLALCGPPLSKSCSSTMPSPPPSVEEEKVSQPSSAYDWEVMLPGYGCGLIFGLVMGYVMIFKGKPQWFFRIMEGEQRHKEKEADNDCS